MKLKQIMLAAAVMAAMMMSSTVVSAKCGFCGFGEKGKKSEAREAKINTAGLAALIAAKTPMTIIDARSGKYDDGQRIPGARSLNAASSDDEIKAMLPDKSVLIVTYCQNPECPAGPQLAEKLKKMGCKNVIEYPEGIEGWQKAGHEAEKTK